MLTRVKYSSKQDATHHWEQSNSTVVNIRVQVFEIDAQQNIALSGKTSTSHTKFYLAHYANTSRPWQIMLKNCPTANFCMFAPQF